MIEAGYEYEKEHWQQGYRYIAGIDEVGRGPLAGPVVAAAVILPFNTSLIYALRDSKTLTAKRREALSGLIFNTSISCAIGKVEAGEIDKIGIKRATELAMIKAVKGLSKSPDRLLIDFFTLKEYPPQIQTGITKGDAICASIAAASIIAKVYRDDLMTKLHDQFPEYGFHQHKGYGTDNHRAAILEHGPSPHHRLSFLHHIMTTTTDGP